MKPKTQLLKPVHSSRAVKTGTYTSIAFDDEQGDLFYSVGPYGRLRYPHVTQVKTGERIWKKWGWMNCIYGTAVRFKVWGKSDYRIACFTYCKKFCLSHLYFLTVVNLFFLFQILFNHKVASVITVSQTFFVAWWLCFALVISELDSVYLSDVCLFWCTLGRHLIWAIWSGIKNKLSLARSLSLTLSLTLSLSLPFSLSLLSLSPSSLSLSPSLPLFLPLSGTCIRAH